MRLKGIDSVKTVWDNENGRFTQVARLVMFPFWVKLASPCSNDIKEPVIEGMLNFFFPFFVKCLIYIIYA